MIYNVVLVSGVQQSDSVIYKRIHVYILFQILFPYRLKNIEYSSLCYTVGPYCLSILFHFKKLKKNFTGVELVYSVVLVSGVQWRDGFLRQCVSHTYYEACFNSIKIRPVSMLTREVAASRPTITLESPPNACGRGECNTIVLIPNSVIKVLVTVILLRQRHYRCLGLDHPLMRGVLGTAGCGPASLVSTHQMSGAPRTPSPAVTSKHVPRH